MSLKEVSTHVLLVIADDPTSLTHIREEAREELRERGLIL